VEGTLEVTPSLISLPANSSITRDLSVKAFNTSGEITLRPVVGGCSFASKKITVTNLASGNFSSLSMKTTFEENDSQGTITLEIANPTTRIFNGIVRVNAPDGWSSNTKEVTITPGTNIITIPIVKSTNTQSGRGSVSFISDGQEITNEFNVSGDSSSFAGLFSLGLLGITNLGTILLIILVVILIVGLIVNITDSKPRKQEEWEEKD
jgi:hypothetical protein